ncbi:MAG: cytochrome C [Chlorobi bacterium]|nr:cytochrome C [Chlorobiota bacterium]
MKLPKSFYSWTTAIGAAIASISFVSIVFMILLSFLTNTGSSYSGLITYIILPVFLVIGLILIPVGVITKSIKDRKRKVVREHQFPIVDLNQPVQRRILFYFGIISTVLILGTAYGSYEAYHYTESTEFCGKLCHRVMEPEYDTYQESPHSRVACVECHVGTGASWYVKSKLSGLRQVISVTFDLYPRPIPTPIHNLRPARETCEECHWPQKFYPRQLVVNKHFLPDEKNTEWDILLLMKVGPLHNGSGLSEGIHWHISPNVKVEYYSSDSTRNHIPWVRYINKETGDTTVFTDPETGNIRINPDSVRVMDCLDCHNRPSHNFPSPMQFVNQALAGGTLPKTLPDLKSLAMQVLNTHYPSTDSALKAISTQVDEYYQTTYEDIYRNKKDTIALAIAALQDEYQKHIFPSMNVTWDKYPNHIGHLEFDGCFRCHNNRHISSGGKVISKDCTLCHAIIGQGVSDTLRGISIFKDLPFVHPEDPDGMWKEMNCSECHKDLYSM